MCETTNKNGKYLVIQFQDFMVRWLTQNVWK